MIVIATINSSRAIFNYSSAALDDKKLAIQISNNGPIGTLYGSIKPAHALAIDQKMDDGVYSTGDFLSSDGITGVGSRRNCVSGANYNVSYDGELDGCLSLLVLKNL